MTKQTDTKANKLNNTNKQETNATNNKKDDEIGKSSHVRFTDEVRELLATEKKNTGKSIPRILIDAFLKKPTSKPIFQNDIGLDIRKELNRIGVNLNQLTKKLNTGLYDGWYPEMNDIRSELSQTLCLIANYGKGKK